MSKPEAEESNPTPMVLDALSHPFARLGWLIMIVACTSGLVGLMSLEVISIRIVFVALVLAGVVVRCYFCIVENTITGWGTEAWQSDGFRLDGLWGSLGAVFGVAVVSWLPAFGLGWALRSDRSLQELAVNVATAFGCEYFCMGVLALIVFQNFSQAMPHRVIPAIARCGVSYLLAGLGLALVPISFYHVFGSFGPDDGFKAGIAASAIAAFFLIAHARLVGLLYLTNRECIGWQ